MACHEHLPVAVATGHLDLSFGDQPAVAAPQPDVGGVEPANLTLVAQSFVKRCDDAASAASTGPLTDSSPPRPASRRPTRRAREASALDGMRGAGTLATDQRRFDDHHLEPGPRQALGGDLTGRPGPEHDDIDGNRG